MMRYLSIVENRATGERWLQIPLAATVDDDDKRAVVSYGKRFLAACERKFAREDREIGELEQLYLTDGGATSDDAS